jgi:hypothetical protein
MQSTAAFKPVSIADDLTSGARPAKGGLCAGARRLTGHGNFLEVAPELVGNVEIGANFEREINEVSHV